MVTKLRGLYLILPLVIGNVEDSQSGRYRSLCQAFQGLSVLGSCSSTRHDHLLKVISEQKIYIENGFTEEKCNETSNRIYDGDDEYENIMDPPDRKSVV